MGSYGYPPPPACHHPPPPACYHPPPPAVPCEAPPMHYGHHHHSHHHHHHGHLLCKIIAFIVGLALAIGACILLVMLLTHSRESSPQFTITAVSVSGFNFTADHKLSANFDITFSFNNPSHTKKVGYRDLTVRVYYNMDSIAQTTMAPLSLGYMSKETFHANMAAVSVPFGDVGGSLLKDDRADGSMTFQVRVNGEVSSTKFGIPWKWYWRFRSTCHDIIVGFGSSNATSGAFSGQPKDEGGYVDPKQKLSAEKRNSRIELLRSDG